jgi:hypothetical protein
MGITLALTTMSLLCLAVILPARDAVAQQQQRVSDKATVENTKYPQQLNIDVGDVPNHIVRIFEIHRTYPINAPVINGLKLVEEWDRAIADLTDSNGTATSYYVHVMENGDKFFARVTSVAQNAGPGKFTITAAGPITGGTGKLAGIQGIVRATGTVEPKGGFNETQFEIEYWIEKEH